MARQRSSEERVTPLELFFDLIFVFAITQVTGLVVADPTWGGSVQGLLVLGVLWWSWAAYAWLTNTINPEEGIVRIAMFGAMAAMLIASLAVPDVFGDDAFLFACAYAMVRIAAPRAVRRRRPRRPRPARGRCADGSRHGGECLAPLRRRPRSTARCRSAVWAVALLVDLLGVYIGGGKGWHLAPSHFAERHALIVIIALGESIVALGLGASHELDAGVDRGCVARVRDRCRALVGVLRRRCDRRRTRLREATGNAQMTMARDAYSYLHLPMVAGIILFASASRRRSATSASR